jgi:hypothetical protein
MKKESYNKILLFMILSLVLSSLTLDFIIAQQTGTNNLESQVVADSIKIFVRETFSPLFVDKAWGTRALMAVLLFMVIYNVTPLIFGEESKIINIGISVIITSLSLMAMPSGFLEGLALQYGAMGATILAIIPFAVILMITVTARNALFARVLWIFYAVYFLGLYGFSLVASYQGQTEWLTGKNLPYLIGIIAGIIMFFCVGGIRRLLIYGETKAMEEAGEAIAERGGLLHKLQMKELRTSYGVRTRR